MDGEWGINEKIVNRALVLYGESFSVFTVNLISIVNSIECCMFR